jgi:hypothetical protein
MAEPAVMSAPVIVLAFGEWGRNVAITLSAAERPPIVAMDGAACRPAKLFGERAFGRQLAVVVAAGFGNGEGADPDRAGGADALRSELEARRVTHLTVARDERSIWVGPTVAPARPGCDACWQARRRQHAEALTLSPAPGDVDLVAPAARAALAVIRRVLASPETEAGVVRRFVPGGGSPAIGRVIPVAGCARCDPSAGDHPGWSLRSLAPPERATVCV